MPKRIDVIPVQNLKLDTNGFLSSPAYLTKTGVFTYYHPDGSITKELRHSLDVFNENSIKTLELLPVTINHPLTEVNPKNVRNFAVGTTSEKIDIEEPYIKSKIKITDHDAIVEIDKGRFHEVSMGYNAEIIPEEGVYDGKHYDHRQTNIRYNHAALVQAGRAGHQVRLHLDAADGVTIKDWVTSNLEDSEDSEMIKTSESSETSKSSKSSKSSKVLEDSKSISNKGIMKIKKDGVKTKYSRFDSIDITIPDEAESSINTIIIQRDQAIEKVRELEEKCDSLDTKFNSVNSQQNSVEKELNDLKKEKETLQAKIDESQESLKKAQEDIERFKSDDAIQERVDERLNLERIAANAGINDIKKFNNDELRLQVILKKHPEFKADGKSSDYLSARFDAVVEQLAEDKKDEDEAKKTRNDARKATTSFSSEKKDEDEDPRLKFQKKSEEAYKANNNK